MGPTKYVTKSLLAATILLQFKKGVIQSALITSKGWGTVWFCGELEYNNTWQEQTRFKGNRCGPNWIFTQDNGCRYIYI